MNMNNDRVVCDFDELNKIVNKYGIIVTINGDTAHITNIKNGHTIRPSAYCEMDWYLRIIADRFFEKDDLSDVNIV